MKPCYKGGVRHPAYSHHIGGVLNPGYTGDEYETLLKIKVEEYETLFITTVEECKTLLPTTVCVNWSPANNHSGRVWNPARNHCGGIWNPVYYHSGECETLLTTTVWLNWSPANNHSGRVWTLMVTTVEVQNLAHNHSGGVRILTYNHRGEVSDNVESVKPCSRTKRGVRHPAYSSSREVWNPARSLRAKAL